MGKKKVDNCRYVYNTCLEVGRNKMNTCENASYEVVRRRTGKAIGEFTNVIVLKRAQVVLDFAHASAHCHGRVEKRLRWHRDR
jgi:hypothetical protein